MGLSLLHSYFSLLRRQIYARLSRQPQEGFRREPSSDPASLRMRAIKEQWQGDALYGVAPVLAALRAGRRTAYTLYLQQGGSSLARASVLM